MRARRDSGSKLLVAYITAGARSDWLELLLGVSQAGVDGIEVGIPFSDPVMDGPVIQEACTRALGCATTLQGILAELETVNLGVPLIAMSYYNPILALGLAETAHGMVKSHLAGSIIPDLSLEETKPWHKVAHFLGIDTVLLVAPSTPKQRVKLICDESSGFVYAVGVMGVTGERSSLAGEAVQVVEAIKSFTDTPVLVGVGVSDAAQAAQVCQVADGVVVGSAIMRRVLAGESINEIASFVAGIRQGIA